MLCPACGSTSRVIKSHQQQNRTRPFRRRRRCLAANCGMKWTTTEVPDKKDPGARSTFKGGHIPPLRLNADVHEALHDYARRTRTRPEVALAEFAREALGLAE